MGDKTKRMGQEFAEKLLKDMEQGIIQKDCMTNHFKDFTGGMEALHRDRYRSYMSSCGCYLMDLRLKDMEEEYHG